MQENVSLFVALGGGLLSFLSPCVLPLVPAYFASLAGTGIFEGENRRVRFSLFFHSMIFVLGFTVVFTGLGAIAGLLGFTISSQLLLRKIAGIALIVFGVLMLLATRVPWLNFEKRLAAREGSTSGYLRSLIIGAIFAFAWTPCAGPILGGVLALALDSATAWKGAYLLVFYSLGLGIPFLAIGIGFDFLMPHLKKLQRFTTYIYLVSGLLLITTGILTLTRVTW